MGRYRAGQRIGRRALASLLGRGGDAEVWRAQDEGGTCVALKILHTQKKNSEPYRRFIQEVRVQSGLKNHRGILPLLDFDLPADTTGPAWIAMPEAESIRERLGAAPTLGDVVAAIAEIATTLAELASQDIAHRDVKPENLYWYAGSYRIGDFGLVAHPSNDPMTEHGKPLGPRWYHAPEMLTSPDTSDGKPADVFSLAKTLWVLAAGQQFPVPGEQRIDQPHSTLSTTVAHDRGYLLDRLIERATSLDPRSRPTMAEFRDELLAWLSPRIESVSPPRLDAIVERLRALSEVDRRTHERQLAELDLAIRALAEFDRAIVGVASALAATPFGGPQWSQDNTIIGLSAPLAPEGADGPCGLAFSDGRGTCLNPPLQDHHFWAGIGARLFTNGDLYLVAAYAIGPTYQPRLLWREDSWALLGSAKQEQGICKLAASFSETLPGCLDKFADKLDQLRRGKVGRPDDPIEVVPSDPRLRPCQRDGDPPS